MTKTVTVITFTILLGALSACMRVVGPRLDGPPDPKPAPVSPQKPQTIAPKKTTCDLWMQNFQQRPELDENDPVQVHIERHFQRVIRKDCSGKVTSNKIETVKSPTQQFELQPKTRLKNVAGVVLFNLETCQAADSHLPRWDLPFLGALEAITGRANGIIDLKGDLAPAVFTFQLKEGVNHLYYSYFQNCLPVDLPPMKFSEASSEYVCDKAKLLRSGVYTVIVDYQEKTLDGELEINAADCEKKDGK